MRKLKRKFLRIGGRKAICLLAVVGTIVLLTSMAMAVMTEQEITPENCPNHTEHDESCGYVEAVEGQPCNHEHTEECYVDGELNCQHVHDESCGYVEAVEGQPCEHKCPVCDPVEKIEEKVDGKDRIYDKNEIAIEHQDVEIQFVPHSDVLCGVALVTEDRDEKGNPILQQLQENIDYTLNSAAGDVCVVYIKNEYLDLQNESTLVFQLQFESGNQEMAIKVVDSQDLKEKSDFEDTQKKDETENVINKVDKSPTVDGGAQTFENETYNINGTLSSLPDGTEKIKINQTQGGVLSLSISLPLGEKGRFLDIIYPEYGFGIPSDSFLPPADGKVIKSEVTYTENGRKAVRIYISDSVDETVDLQLKYKAESASINLINNLIDGVQIKETGFQVQIRNGSRVLLAEKTIANFGLELVEGKGFVGSEKMTQFISNGGLTSNKKIEVLVPENIKDGMGPFARFVKMKIYIPNPEIIETSLSRNINFKESPSADSWSGYRYKKSELQSDGENWWYELSDIPINNFKASVGGKIWIEVANKIAPNVDYHMIKSENLSVKDTEVTIKLYGREEEIKIPVVFKMNPYVDVDMFESIYGDGYYGHVSGHTYASYDAYVGEADQVGGIISLRNASDFNTYGATEHIAVHQGKGTTTVYEFPYEIQPTKMNFECSSESSWSTMEYFTSDGTVHSVKNTGQVVNFDEISDDKRVTKIIVTWDKIFGTDNRSILGSAKMQFTYKVPKEHENGSVILGGERAQVKYECDVPESGKSYSNDSYIWFEFKKKDCPGLIWKGEKQIDIAKNDMVINSDILMIDQNKNELNYVTDPIIRISMMVNKVYGDFPYFSGRFTAMPFIAGWNVHYTTSQGVEMNYQLPTDIPIGGVEILLPKETDDQLIKEFSLTKEGEVKWENGTEVLKGIETFGSREETLFRDNPTYNMNLSANFSFSNCPDGKHISDAIFLPADSPGCEQIVGSDYEMYKFIEIKVSDGPANEVIVQNTIYQGASSSYIVKKGILFEWNNVDLISKLEILSGKYNKNVFPFKKKVTMYVELKNPDILNMSEKTFLQMTTELSETDISILSDVSYQETEDGRIWLKIESIDPLDIMRMANASFRKSLFISFDGYTLPGAVLGRRDIIGDVYLDCRATELQMENDGSKQSNYIKYTFSDLVPDSAGLLQDGDSETPRLYLYKSDYSQDILQKAFSGLSIIPGKRGNYEIDSREVKAYPADLRDLNGMISIGVSNEELKNYECIVEIPKAGKSVEEVDLSEQNDKSVKSDFSMGLTAPIQIKTNPSGALIEFSYRMLGSMQWLDADEVADWNQVDGVKIFIEKLDKYAAVNLILDMKGDRKNKEEPEYAYIGGEFSYLAENGVNAKGKAVLGKYISCVNMVQGNVWIDKNENGERDSSEPMASGITIHAKRIEDGSVVDTQVTDTNGNYQFKFYESQGLYLEIDLPNNMRLTRQSLESDFMKSDSDSDFERETLCFQLPGLNGDYTNIGCGVVNLPVLYAPDIVVAEGKSLAGKAVATSDRGSLIYLNYEATADESIATVRSGSATSNSTIEDGIGWVKGMSLGETTAKVWVENSLGDRVESTYKITVVPDVVDFTLGKNLTSASREDETFVFMIEHQDEDGQTDEIFYQTVKIPAGSQSGSIEIKKVKPGSYRITELDSNWRYSAQGGNVKNITMDDSEESYRVDFTNTKDTDAWISGKTEVTNTMQDTAP